MSGDVAALEIDSDEAVIKGQLAYLQQMRERKSSLGNKRPRGGLAKGVSSSNTKQKTEGLLNDIKADESFVGKYLLFAGGFAAL